MSGFVHHLTVYTVYFTSMKRKNGVRFTAVFSRVQFTTRLQICLYAIVHTWERVPPPCMSSIWLKAVRQRLERPAASRLRRVQFQLSGTTPNESRTSCRPIIPCKWGETKLLTARIATDNPNHFSAKSEHTWHHSAHFVFSLETPCHISYHSTLNESISTTFPSPLGLLEGALPWTLFDCFTLCMATITAVRTLKLHSRGLFTLANKPKMLFGCEKVQIKTLHTGRNLRERSYEKVLAWRFERLLLQGFLERESLTSSYRESWNCTSAGAARILGCVGTVQGRAAAT